MTTRTVFLQFHDGVAILRAGDDFHAPLPLGQHSAGDRCGHADLRQPVQFDAVHQWLTYRLRSANRYEDRLAILEQGDQCYLANGATAQGPTSSPGQDVASPFCHRLHLALVEKAVSKLRDGRLHTGSRQSSSGRSSDG